jgi:Zn-dependent peptidase ImmA (M78 family)
MPPERRNFAFCHELAHHILHHSARETLSMDMEREANKLAAELLLPPESFRNDAAMYHLDQLKELYPQASWEVIARSKLSVVPAVLTIYDNGKRKLRIATNNYRFHKNLMPLEKRVFEYCLLEQTNHKVYDDTMKVRGYFIDTGEGVQRVMLWTEYVE